jgi:hypothetical protein
MAALTGINGTCCGNFGTSCGKWKILREILRENEAKKYIFFLGSFI